MEVTVAPVGDQSTLTVENSGPQIPAQEVDRLLQPFQRLGTQRVKPLLATTDPGDGLGLSIVAAIADAHDADLQLRPAPAGGLIVEVRFPTYITAERGPSRAPGVAALPATSRAADFS